MNLINELNSIEKNELRGKKLLILFKKIRSHYPFCTTCGTIKEIRKRGDYYGSDNLQQFQKKSKRVHEECERRFRHSSRY